MARVRTKAPPRRTVFLSYCHVDYKHARDCVQWLRPMCRDPADAQREPGIWVDYEALKGGAAWEASILAAIDAADVFIVLMSIGYANSSFCMQQELRRMLVKRQRGQARVIGVALHEVLLKDFAVSDGGRTLRLEEVQCLPQGQIRDGSALRLGLKAVTRWGSRQDAWHAVRVQIESALAQAPVHIAAAPPALPAVAPATPAAAQPAPGVERLPFLCDRQPQQDRLRDRLDAWQQAGSRRPLLVVTEGRYVDCVQEWVERMHGNEIPAVLDFFATQGLSFGEARYFVWPTAADAATAANRLRAAFASALGLGPMKPIDDVHRAQSTPGLPALWWSECSDDDGSGAPLATLQGLLTRLAEWPDLDRRSMLVLALVVVRDDASAAGARALLGGPFESLLRDADAAGKVACVALGSLPEVDRPAITAWSQDAHVKPRLRVPPPALPARLPAGQRSWSMRTFADMAAGWLQAP